MDSMEEIKIRAPGPRTCPICAVVHAPDQPHDRDSVYYQNRFWKRYKRLPTWADAMSHCSEAAKAAFIEALAERGIDAGANTDHGA